MDHIYKKKLDFCRPTFDEREFKIPCREITNSSISLESHKSRMRSEKSTFADDEESCKESDVSSLSSVSSVVNTVGDKVFVYLRLKPTDEMIPDVYYFDEETHNVILRSHQSLVSTERQYTFSSILHQQTDQRSVYEQTVRPLLNEPFSSIGASICSYGVSNSGKTYTILGEQSAGIVPRALTQIFTEYGSYIATYPCIKVANDQILILEDSSVEIELDRTEDLLKDYRKFNKTKITDNWIDEIRNDHDFQSKDLGASCNNIFIWISFVEIYNEKIIDLFQESKPDTATMNRQLKIISNNGNSYILGLNWLHVSKLEDAKDLLYQGLRKVNYAKTGINANSSRSHTIFTINMISECDSSYEFSNFKFCDLAGAERISKTGTVGDRLKEAGKINTSLVVLGRCLEAVQHNQKRNVKKEIVPVRESKLTFLLQGSLMGRERFIMIVNLLPTIEFYEENVNVLHFGSIANKIVTKKTESRKFSRCSSRYTYFMQHAVNSPKMNSSLAYNESM
jgi:kinesin family member 20